MGVRPERVANAIRRELCNIIHQDLKDPRIGFTTITKVEVSPDLRNAKIYYSVLGNGKKRKSTEIALENAKGFIKRLIGNRLKLRFMPEISFKIDKSFEYTERIDKILDKISKEKSEKEKSE